MGAHSKPVDVSVDRARLEGAVAEILARHEQALDSRMSTYLDPVTGFVVFTADYLSERGYCCSAGCRHCPWEGGWRRPADD